MAGIRGALDGSQGNRPPGKEGRSEVSQGRVIAMTGALEKRDLDHTVK